MYEELKKLAELARDNCPTWYHADCFSLKHLDGGDGQYIEAVNPRVILELIAENDSMRDSLRRLNASVDSLAEEKEIARIRIKELDLLFGRYILAMRAAVIEENAEKGMEWIYNSLAGPGELPPEDETDAQAYFDREIIAVEKGMDEVLAFHDARQKAKEATK